MTYVEFSFSRIERFNKISTVFNSIKEAKITNDFRDDNYWLELFDEESRKNFWWPTEQEVQEWELKWKLSNHDPDTVSGWTFGSMILAFEDGEYELVSCSQKDANKGRMDINTYSWPFGGLGCFEMLIQAFGGEVTEAYE